MQSVRQIEARAALIIADLIEEAVEEAKEDPTNAKFEKPVEAIKALKMFNKAGVLRNVCEWTLSNEYDQRIGDARDPREVIIHLLDNALAVY